MFIELCGERSQGSHSQQFFYKAVVFSFCWRDGSWNSKSNDVCLYVHFVTAARLQWAVRRNDRHPFWAFLGVKHFHLRKLHQHDTEKTLQPTDDRLGMTRLVWWCIFQVMRQASKIFHVTVRWGCFSEQAFIKLFCIKQGICVFLFPSLLLFLSLSISIFPSSLAHSCGSKLWRMGTKKGSSWR